MITTDLPEVPTRTIFKTPGYNPFAVKNVKVSPFDGNLLAVAASQNFGLRGGGRLFVIQRHGLDAASAELLAQLDFPDGIFDVAWAEIGGGEELIVGGGDGRVWRVNWRRSERAAPLPAHSKEISSLDWCPHRVDKFCSTGWDGKIKIFEAGRGETTLHGHGAVVNEARWNPRTPNTLISASADRTLRIWDDRTSSCSALIAPANLSIPDFLSVDWNKYEDWNVASATPSDLLFWDLRMIGKGPHLRIPQAHRRAIKRIRWNPWNGNLLGSVAFDMSFRLWDTLSLNPLGGSGFSGFTEFATGIDWSNFERNIIFTCSWDETVREHFIK